MAPGQAKCARGTHDFAVAGLEVPVTRVDDALVQHERLPAPLERARTLLVLGAVQRRAKRKAAARAALEEGLAIAERIGARLWVERARAELERVGGRSRSDGLDPTESRVAALVAEGRTNREVADTLFVTVRAVEANLTRIYAKLGVRSRSELASKHGPTPDAPPPPRRSPGSGPSMKKISIVMSGSTWAWLRNATTLRPVRPSIAALYGRP